jgi:outer membrane protein OmpA-like peptidoglycan-associated protein
MMKKLLFLLPFFATLLSVIPAQAQHVDRPWGFGIHWEGRDFTGLNDNKFFQDDLQSAIRLHLGRYLNPSFDVQLTGSIVPWSTTNGHPRVQELLNADLAFRYKLNNGYMIPERAILAPYILAGFGANFQLLDSTVTNLEVPLGAGFRLQAGDVVSFDFGAAYRLSVSDFVDYMSYTAGLTLNFGKGKEPKPEPIVEVAPVDTDNDGIPDINDDCPLEAGLAQFRGCPDTDGDGLADKTDGCPLEFGPKDNNGCPVIIADRDGDGVPDETDLCPDQKGSASMKGCPDRDNDLIADKDDECPDVKGLAAFKGCPDRDNDGIRDQDDACPDVAGIAELKGCPEVKEEVKQTLEFAAKNVQFETGKTTLKVNSKTILDEIVTIMNDYPEYSIRMEGYTDNVGSDINNQKLSEGRAASCADYLIEKGIDPTRIVYSGFGESDPIGDNNTPEGRALNRRVEFELFVK